MKQLLENPDLISAEDRENLIKNLIANLDSLDSETQKALIKELLSNPNLLPAEEREQLLKNLIKNIGSLDP